MIGSHEGDVKLLRGVVQALIARGVHVVAHLLTFP
jgi:hypothetical protein